MPLASKWDPASLPSFWLNRASRLLLRTFETRLRPLDLGMAYLPVLLALAEHDALQQKQLAEHACVEQPTMAALLGRMMRDGLVAKTPHPRDKRAAMLSLTAKARQNLPRTWTEIEAIAELVTLGFSEDERATFLALLQRAVDNLERHLDVEPCA